MVILPLYFIWHHVDVWLNLSVISHYAYVWFIVDTMLTYGLICFIFDTMLMYGLICFIFDTMLMHGLICLCLTPCLRMVDLQFIYAPCLHTWTCMINCFCLFIIIIITFCICKPLFKWVKYFSLMPFWHGQLCFCFSLILYLDYEFILQLMVWLFR